MKAVFFLPLVVFAAMAAMGQQPPPPHWSASPVKQVASFDELQPKTPAERAAAGSLHGHFPLRPGNWGIGRGQLVSIWFPSTSAERLEREVCGAHAIVAGHSVANHVIVDNGQSTLIMVDDFRVSDWVKPQKRSKDLEVFTLGGQVQVGENAYSMAYDGEGSWLLDGQPMLLFLQTLEPGAYLNRSREMSIPITGGRVALDGADGPIDDVLAKLRAISTKCP